MKKILSILMAVSIVLITMTTSFAAEIDWAGSYSLKLVPSKTTVANGDTFTVDVVLADTTGADVDMTGVMFGATVAYPTALTLNTTATTTSNSMPTNNFSYGEGQAILAITADTKNATYNASTPVVTLSFTVNAVADEYVLTLSNDGIANASGVMVMCDGEGCTIAYSAEEVFEPTYEGVKAEDGTVTEGFASGSKVATVFAKATGDLAAGTYGIVFGGQKYVGAADVKDGKYWVIRLYDPSGNILTGASYTCQKFVGDDYETVDYELENN